MKYYTNKLKEFNRAFKVPVAGTLDKASEFRYDLLKEENYEYLEANLNDDIHDRRKEIVDALTDQLYILVGTIVHHGLEDHIQEAFSVVHKSNMSKLNNNGEPIINGINGEDKRKPKGKILKSENFIEPNFDRILIAY